MTDEPEIPVSLRATWDQLNRRAIPALRAADEAQRQAATEVQRLIVSLLRGGLRRELLVNRPYSSAWLTRIQRANGLVARKRPPARAS
jgi:hypothetical protein